MAFTWNPVFDWDNDEWRRHAACRYTDPELFFPAGSTGAVIEAQVQAAKAVCRACPVQEACLRFALETNQHDGVWGGKTEEERIKLRRSWLAARRRRSGSVMA